MQPSQSFQRVAGLLALVAGPLSLASLVVGVSVVDFNFDAFTDPAAMLSLNAAAARLIRWSYWLSMFGSYLFLVPLALWLDHTLPTTSRVMLRSFTLCGLGYLALGAAGAAILAAVWPTLMMLAPTLPAEQQSALQLLFVTVTAIAEDGLQGLLQNVLGSIWFIGVGSLLWHQRRFLGGFTCLIGFALALTTLATLFDSESLGLLGLIATLLLVPAWSVWVSIVALRTRHPFPA